MSPILQRLLVRYGAFGPNHRGKARGLDMASRVFGTTRIRLANGIDLPLRMNSSMDLSYVRAAREKPSLVASLLDRLRPGDCYVDVGANVGYYTVQASKRVGPEGVVVAVEPSTREFVRLLQSISWNDCANVISVRAALGNRSGIIRLDVESSHTGLNHISEHGREIVPLFRGDALLPELIGDRRTFIKIDVEGAEPLVMEGMRGVLARPMTQAVVAEMTPSFSAAMGLDIEAAHDLMQGLGYTVRGTEGSGAGTDTWFERSTG